MSADSSVLRHGDLVLEPIVPAHASALWDELQDPELYTFTPHDPPASREALASRYERWAARRSPDGTEIWLNYAVFRPADGRYLGLVQATLQENGTTYLAYEVFPAHWRRGIARRACTALIDHLFAGHAITAVSALVDTRNQASWRLLEALGFRRTHTLPDADRFKGATSDEHAYRLLRAEWEAAAAGRPGHAGREPRGAAR